ncbi:hypothetical protein GII30_00120 [Gordonia amarae]|uniref:Uncharacterized protein n=1 Tax=Gordonia amarae TaxID=36821 RepID=A0A857M643_9ACTN|nr:hypothetical protein [Gordonia amarae]MCS3876741.1 hypothetical protein [Gordonia amarae]QHN15593.1 hypothetical protein GII35_00120 [Gordonia amarae]QHN20163.1 hypothetical protein GII34_00120 [Gordonia amarae]QHN29013.1 hypothetical protein GII32_00120 [Gordonia amarae]QHN37794.1 hypothetical protein GII30_00120 [Gordonia amarae]
MSWARPHTGPPGGASLGKPLAARVVDVAGTGDSGLGVFALVCTALLILACAAAVLATRTGNRL